MISELGALKIATPRHSAKIPRPNSGTLNSRVVVKLCHLWYLLAPRTQQVGQIHNKFIVIIIRDPRGMVSVLELHIN